MTPPSGTPPPPPPPSGAPPPPPPPEDEWPPEEPEDDLDPARDDEPPQRSRARWAIAGGAGALLLIAAGIGVYLLLFSDSKDPEVFLQPVNAAGQDPFTDSVANMKVTDLTSNGENIAGDPVSGVEGGDRSVESVEGSTPRLYGGTNEEDACDPDALVDYLEDNPDKAQAWADAQGIEVDEIKSYVSTLTPVILREDTRVTNNGFADGHATPFQAVLQAGTAVLVDDQGVPRARCACGNPLSEPEATEDTPEYTGEHWSKFDQNRIIAVRPAPKPVTSFRLVNVKTGEEFDRTAGNPLTTDDLLNARIPACGQPVKRWVNGHYPGEGDEIGSSGPLLARVAGIGDLPGAPQVQVGDFTGDGAVDGAVAVLCNTDYAPSSAHFEVHAFDSSGDSIGQIPFEDDLPETAIPSNSYVEDLQIADGRVSFAALTSRPGDALCCPTGRSTLSYEWNGSDFELATPEEDPNVGQGDVEDLVFDYGGVGPLRIGMTEEEAEAATGLDFDIEPSVGPESCYGISISGLDDKLTGLSLDGRTITSLGTLDPIASTTMGIEIGSSREELEAAYWTLFAGDEAHDDGYEFLYTEQGPEQNTLRFLVLPTGVASIEVGRPPAIHLPEGCT